MRELFKIVAVVTACAGGYVDLKTQKIPNKLTLTGIATGFIIRTFIWGIDGLLGGMAGFGVGCIPVFLWLIGGVKAGDVKLYMLVGVWGGWKFGVNTEICSLFLGGVAAVILLILRKNGIYSIKSLWQYLQYLIFSGMLVRYEGNEKSYFCFGWTIGAGALITFILGI